MPGIYIYMHVQNHAYTNKSRCTYICDICQLLNPASPLETQQNCVTTPSEILRPKTKTHGSSTWFFLDHPGNSILQTMLFLIKPGKFHQLFLQYPWKFHILLENICHKTTYTQEIELINSDVSEREKTQIEEIYVIATNKFISADMQYHKENMQIHSNYTRKPCKGMTKLIQTFILNFLFFTCGNFHS